MRQMTQLFYIYTMCTYLLQDIILLGMLTIHKSDPSLNDKFYQARQKLRDILGDDVSIEHVGSTAVPGVDGKGIIDIMVGCNGIDEMRQCADKLVSNGFFPARRNASADRILVTSRAEDTIKGDIHVHIVVQGSPEAENFIAIRDYLRLHPDVAAEYSRLKHHIAASVNFDRELYKKQKSGFLSRILE